MVNIIITYSLKVRLREGNFLRHFISSGPQIHWAFRLFNHYTPSSEAARLWVISPRRVS